jgi:hypothetical protein
MEKPNDVQTSTIADNKIGGIVKLYADVLLLTLFIYKIGW